MEKSVSVPSASLHGCQRTLDLFDLALHALDAMRMIGTGCMHLFDDAHFVTKPAESE